MEGLVRQLRAQLAQGCDQYPVELISEALVCLEAIEAQLSPELTESDNDYAHQAQDMLCLVLDDLHAAYTEFTTARDTLTDYARTR